MQSSSRVLVDANILLRIILRDDERLFNMARDVVNEADRSSVIVTPVIAAEVMYICRSRHYTREQSAKALSLVMTHEAFVKSTLLQKCIRLYAETSLDFADCYLLARALRTGETLETFDKKLQKAYKQLQED